MNAQCVVCLIRLGLVVARQPAGELLCALLTAAKGCVHAAFVLALCIVAWGWRCACADRLAEGRAAMMHCVRVTMKWRGPVCLGGAGSPVCAGWRGGVWRLPVHTRVVSSSGQAMCWVGASVLGSVGSLCVCGCFSRQRESPWCRGCMVCVCLISCAHRWHGPLACTMSMLCTPLRGRGCCLCACQAAESARWLCVCFVCASR